MSMCVYCWRTTKHIPWRTQYEKDERTRDTSKTIYLRDKIEDFFLSILIPVTSVYIYIYGVVNGEILMYKMVQRFINIFPITKVFRCYLLSSIITNEKKIKSCFWCVLCQLYHNVLANRALFLYPLKQ